MAYLNPKFIIVEFLRNRLIDPRTARVNTSKTNNFTATASQTEFTLTPTAGNKMHSITSVTVAGSSKTKWEDYYMDYKSQKVILFTGATVGDAVVIVYKEGTTNWIYPDKADVRLSAASFPRMNILIPGNVGVRLGNYESPVEGTIRFQVDIWCKEKADNQIFTIGSNKYAGNDLGEYLAYKLTEAFEDYESDMHPALYSYDPVGMPRDLPFNEEYQCHHKIVEFIMKGMDIGRIS